MMICFARTVRLSTVCITCIAVTLLPQKLDGQPIDPPATAVARGNADIEAADIEAAVVRGLDWLAAVQQPDGSWGSGAFRSSAAVTATCTMAMVGSGSTATSGPRARAIARAVAFLVASAGGSGLIAAREQAAKPLYAQAAQAQIPIDTTLKGLLDRMPESVMSKASELAKIEDRPATIRCLGFHAPMYVGRSTGAPVYDVESGRLNFIDAATGALVASEGECVVVGDNNGQSFTIDENGSITRLGATPAPAPAAG